MTGLAHRFSKVLTARFSQQGFQSVAAQLLTATKPRTGPGAAAARVCLGMASHCGDVSVQGRAQQETGISFRRAASACCHVKLGVTVLHSWRSRWILLDSPLLPDPPFLPCVSWGDFWHCSGTCSRPLIVLSSLGQHSFHLPGSASF